MAEAWLTALKAELTEMTARLDAPGGERDALKKDIISLFKRVDGALTDLGQIKEDIRGAGRALQAQRQWRRTPSQRRSSPASDPRFTPTTSAPPPISRRAGA